MDLPEITRVQRYRYAPGDRFIVTVPARIPVSDKMASDIVRRFRAAAGLPDGTPVIVLADGWEVTIAGPETDDDDVTAYPGPQGEQAGYDIGY